jgi:hypothetical protein
VTGAATEWFPFGPGLERRYVQYDAVSEEPPRLAVLVGEASLVTVRIRAVADAGRRDPLFRAENAVTSAVEATDGAVRLVEQVERRTEWRWDPPLPILRDGLEGGGSWTWSGCRRYHHFPGGLLMTHGGDRGTMRFEVEALEPVTVIAGTFLACCVREAFELLEKEKAEPPELGAPSPPAVRRAWYAKGVGVVRWETDDGEGDRWRYDLVASPPSPSAS